ncbi:unnamed protein product [Arctogadus glacialis]
MADLFGEIMGEAAAIKGIPMPAPPLVPVSDDMQGECFRTPSSSRRATQCPRAYACQPWSYKDRSILSQHHGSAPPYTWLR